MTSNGSHSGSGGGRGSKPRKKLQRQDSFTKYPKAEAVACPVTMGKFVRRLVRHVSWAIDTRLPMQLRPRHWEATQT